MLEYDRVDVSERIDVKKTSESRRCFSCNCYFLKVYFIFQLKVYDDCQNLIQKALSFNNVTIVFVKRKGNDYRIHFCYMSKNTAINILNDANLNESWSF